MAFPFAPLDGEARHAESFLALLATTPEEQLERAEKQVASWEAASQLVGVIDPFKRIRTVHPCPGLAWSSSNAFTSRDSFDLDMLQTGHSGLASIPDSMEHVRDSLAHGDKPVLNGECSYEGIGGSSWEDVQRFLFWSHMLSGTAGHTYGTMAISTFSSREDHYLPPSTAASADWEDAIEWRGAEHLGIGRRILERLRWWEFQPSPDAIEPHAGPDDWFRPYAATHPDGTLVVYVPGIGQSAPARNHTVAWLHGKKSILKLAPGDYRSTFVSPRTGADEPTVSFTTPDGTQPLSGLVESRGFPRETPTWEDWVLVVRPGRSVRSVSESPWDASADEPTA